FLRGDGAGGFAVQGASSPTGARPAGLVAAELTRDGRPDVAVATSNAVASLANIGAPATFPPQLSAPVVYGVGADAIALVTGDLDGRGAVDVAILSSSQNRTVLFGSATGALSPQPGMTIANASDLVPLDADRDGAIDLFVPRSVGPPDWSVDL